LPDKIPERLRAPLACDDLIAHGKLEETCPIENARNFG
jgi:hypothetical protein